MAKLIGTAPNQTPTNADLGTMAYQDSNQIKVGTIDAKGKVQATDDVLQQGSISDEAWRECCKYVESEAERVELVLAIGNWGLFSQLLQSLNIPLEDGIESWPPDGKVPGS